MIQNLRFKNCSKSGQTLTLILVFMTVAVIITTATVMVTVVNNTQASKYDQGNATLDVAESGVEDAVMSLLRNPDYTGETLTVGSGTANIVVSVGDFPKTVTVTGTLGNFVRTIQVQVGYSNNVLSVVSWKEIYP